MTSKQEEVVTRYIDSCAALDRARLNVGAATSERYMAYLAACRLLENNTVYRLKDGRSIARVGDDVHILKDGNETQKQ